MTDEPTIDPQTAFQVGDWRIEPDTGRMRCGETEVKLEPKVMTVLLSLANQAGKVVTREQLEATAWAGVIVGYDSLASTIIKLRKAFEDDSKNPRFIETVPKKGYRLIAPVKTLQPEPVHSEVAEQIGVNERTVSRLRERCVEQGLEAGLERQKHVRTKPRRLDGDGEAQLVALMCSEPPSGQSRWTLKLLGNQLVELGVVEAISQETVRRVLKKRL